MNDEKEHLTSDELHINNTEWPYELESNFDKGGKFSTFRCNNKERLLQDTKEYRCFLKLIRDEKDIYGEYLGILEYREGYPFVNNKEANNYNNYNVENYFFIRKDRNIESTMKFIYVNFGNDLKEEDVVLELLNKTRGESIMNDDFERRVKYGDEDKTKPLKLLMEHGYKEESYNCLRALYDVAKNADKFKNDNGTVEGFFKNQDIDNFVDKFNRFCTEISSENMKREDIFKVVSENYQLSASQEEFSERFGILDKNKLHTEKVGMLMNFNQLPDDTIETIKGKVL